MVLSEIKVLYTMALSYCLRHFWRDTVFTAVCLSVCEQDVSKKLSADFHESLEVRRFWTRE